MRVVRCLMAILVFCGFFAAYWPGVYHDPAESVWRMRTAERLLRRGDIQLDEWVAASSPGPDLIRSHGHWYAAAPAGAALAAVPVLLGARLMPEQMARIPLGRDLDARSGKGLERVTASVYTAAAVALFFLFATEFTSLFPSLVAALILGFGTGAWSAASRALWPQGPALFYITLALCIVARAPRSPWLIQFAAPCLLGAAAILPAHMISLVLISLYVVARYPRFRWLYLTWLGLGLTGLAGLHQMVYGTWIPPGLVPAALPSGPALITAMLGHLVSPARGVLVYTPVLLLACAAGAVRMVKGRLELIDGVLAAVPLLHWLLISLGTPWYSVEGYGARQWVDVMPFMLCFLIKTVPFEFSFRTARSSMANTVYILLIILSVAVQWRGALNWGGVLWNDVPVRVEDAPERIWDWSDPPFLRIHVE